jgi:hypothetical protein
MIKMKDYVLIKINDYGLCEKCNRLVKPYYILKSKSTTVRCLKHLPEKEKKIAEIHEKIKDLKEKLNFKDVLEKSKIEIKKIKSELVKIKKSD